MGGWAIVAVTVREAQAATTASLSASWTRPKPVLSGWRGPNRPPLPLRLPICWGGPTVPPTKAPNDSAIDRPNEPANERPNDPKFLPELPAEFRPESPLAGRWSRWISAWISDGISDGISCWIRPANADPITSSKFRTMFHPILGSRFSGQSCTGPHFSPDFPPRLSLCFRSVSRWGYPRRSPGLIASVRSTVRATVRPPVSSAAKPGVSPAAVGPTVLFEHGRRVFLKVLLKVLLRDLQRISSRFPCFRSRFQPHFWPRFQRERCGAGTMPSADRSAPRGFGGDFRRDFVRGFGWPFAKGRRAMMATNIGREPESSAQPTR